MKTILEFIFPGMKEGDYTVGIVLLCWAAVMWLLTAIARWRTFNKMGMAGWKAFIPVYGYFVIFDKCWNKKAAWNYVFTLIVYAFFQAGVYKGSTELVTILCSISELIVSINLLYLTVRINFRMSKAFGHGFWFGLGLWLFSAIFTFILAFGKSEYVGISQPTKKE